MKKIIFIHFCLFIVLITLFFFLSENLLNFILPGFGGVEQWITLIIVGSISISTTIFISCLFFISKKTKKKYWYYSIASNPNNNNCAVASLVAKGTLWTSQIRISMLISGSWGWLEFGSLKNNTISSYLILIIKTI